MTTKATTTNPIFAELTEWEKDLLEHIKTRVQETGGRAIAATVTNVSRSGMSRYIKFITVNQNGNIQPINQLIADITGNKYHYNKGVHVKGCGTDMIFMTLYQFYKELGIDRANERACNYTYF